MLTYPSTPAEFVKTGRKHSATGSDKLALEDFGGVFITFRLPDGLVEKVQSVFPFFGGIDHFLSVGWIAGAACRAMLRSPNPLGHGWGY